MSPVWILKLLVVVFINACGLSSALPSLSQFGRRRLSLVAISFYTLSLHFGPCRLSEFTLAGPLGLKVGAALYKNFLPRVPLRTQIRQWKWHPLLWITLLCLFKFHSTRCIGFRCSRYFKFERTPLSLNMIQKRFRITLSQFASRVLPVVFSIYPQISRSTPFWTWMMDKFYLWDFLNLNLTCSDNNI